MSPPSSLGGILVSFLVACTLAERPHHKLAGGDYLPDGRWGSCLRLADCGGVLVGPKVLLTAAHCAGRAQLASACRHFGLCYVACAKARVPGPDPDLAVVLLREARDGELAETVAFETAEGLEVGQRVYVTGWAAHGNRSRRLRGRWATIEGLGTPRRTCVLIRAEGRIDPGDSGGGVFTSDGPDRRLLGVLSRGGDRHGRGCFEPLSPAMRGFVESWLDRYAERGAAVCGSRRSPPAQRCR